MTSNSLADSDSTANVLSISVGSEAASLYAGKKALAEGTLAFKPATLHRTSELDQAASWKGNEPQKPSHRTASIRVRAEARVTGRKTNGPPSQESLGRVSQAHASRNGKPGAFRVEYWKFCICQRQLKKFPHFAS